MKIFDIIILALLLNNSLKIDFKHFLIQTWLNLSAHKLSLDLPKFRDNIFLTFPLSLKKPNTATILDLFKLGLIMMLPIVNQYFIDFGHMLEILSIPPPGNNPVIDLHTFLKLLKTLFNSSQNIKELLLSLVGV